MGTTTAGAGPVRLRRASTATTSGSTKPTANAPAIPAVTAGAAMAAVQQQHPDQGPGARTVTELAAGGRPERLVGLGEGPRRPGLGQRRRAGHGARLAHQDLEVVFQYEVLGPFVQGPLVDELLLGAGQ